MGMNMMMNLNKIILSQELMRVHVGIMAMMVPRVLRDTRDVVCVTHRGNYFGRTHVIPGQALRGHRRRRGDCGGHGVGRQVVSWWSVRLGHHGRGRDERPTASSSASNMRWRGFRFRGLRGCLRCWRRCRGLVFELEVPKWSGCPSLSSRTTLPTNCSGTRAPSWCLVRLQHLLVLWSSILEPNLDLKRTRKREWENVYTDEWMPTTMAEWSKSVVLSWFWMENKSPDKRTTHKVCEIKEKTDFRSRPIREWEETRKQDRSR